MVQFNGVVVRLLWSITVTITSFTKDVQSIASSPKQSAAQQLKHLILSVQSTPDDVSKEGRGRHPSPAIALPGVHDSLSAKIFADSGARVLFLSGFGVSATKLGEPDAGILTQSEMEDTARSVIRVAAAANNVPVIVDGDTGYGSLVNIRRTVKGLAATGAAAVTIEDQCFPKRCTFAAGQGVRVVSRKESLSRIRAAVAARDEARTSDGHDILIVARTDCRAALGLDEVIVRCKMYEEAGADIVYAEGLKNCEEYRILRANMKDDTPMILAQLQMCQPPPSSDTSDSVSSSTTNTLLTTHDVGELGYNLALFGVTALQAYVHTLQTTAAAFLDPVGGGVLSGTDAASLSSFSNLKDVVGFADADDFERRYSDNHNKEEDI